MTASDPNADLLWGLAPETLEAKYRTPLLVLGVPYRLASYEAQLTGTTWYYLPIGDSPLPFRPALQYHDRTRLWGIDPTVEVLVGPVAQQYTPEGVLLDWAESRQKVYQDLLAPSLRWYRNRRGPGSVQTGPSVEWLDTPRVLAILLDLRGVIGALGRAPTLLARTPGPCAHRE